MFGHSGQGLLAARFSGGRGSSSSWCTLRAPWRWAVPRQSAPVSPPPMMITCLSLAVMKSSSAISSPFVAPVLQRQVLHGEVDALQLAPRDAADRAAASPRRRARWRRTAPCSSLDRHVHADVGVRPELDAFVAHQRSRRRSRNRFSSLNSGMP